MSSEQAQDPEESSEGPPSPEFEVWLHLWSGYDLAYDDLQQTVGPNGAKFFDLLGELVYTALTRLFVDPGDPTLTSRLLEAFPGFSGLDQPSLVRDLFAAYATDSSPALKHSVDLQLAAEAIGRGNNALKRLRRLAGLLSETTLPRRVRQYLAEVVHTFLFGFDAASVALARSAFEQMARQVLVVRGIYSERRLAREQKTAFTLLQALKRNGLIVSSAGQAEALIARGNTVAHKHMYEERIMEEQSFTSVRQLVDVLQELASHLPPESTESF